MVMQNIYTKTSYKDKKHAMMHVITSTARWSNNMKTWTHSP